MARRVFFSFHYDRDIWRVSQVRKSDVVDSSDIQEEGFIDSASWEELKKEGDDAIEAWIDKELKNTSVTVILIGAGTAGRKWVNYEIEQSIANVKGLLGIRIHNVRDSNQNTDIPGSNPLNDYTIEFTDGSTQNASSYYNTYDWVTNSGRDNMGSWIEEAATLAGR